MFVQPIPHHHWKVVLAARKDSNGLCYQTHIQNSIWFVHANCFLIHCALSNISECFFLIVSNNCCFPFMQRDQLASHEAKLVHLGNELAEHKRNAPPSKGLQHQNYIEKDVYLLYEVSTVFA